MSGFESLGWDLGAYLLPGITVLLILVAVGFAFAEFKIQYTDGGYGFIAIVAGIVAAILLVVTLVAAVPYQSRYWTWYKVPAHIEAVSNTLRDASGDLTTSPVVTIDGFDRPVVIDDPRIVTMAGDDVTLACSPTWHFKAADTFECRIYSFGGAR